MALGNIVKTQTPVPIVVWRKAGASVPAIGLGAAFDANGDVIQGINTTDGPLGIRTTESKTVSAVVYYQILIWGMIVSRAGAAISPNKFVSLNATQECIATVTTVTTPTQGEVQALWRVMGMYMGLEADYATNDFAVVAAANTNLIVVFVGRTP